MGVLGPEPCRYTEKGNLSAFICNSQGSVLYETLVQLVMAFARWTAEQRQLCPQTPLQEKEQCAGWVHG